jgi:hypothetical protein
MVVLHQQLFFYAGYGVAGVPGISGGRNHDKQPQANGSVPTMIAGSQAGHGGWGFFAAS